MKRPRVLPGVGVPLLVTALELVPVAMMGATTEGCSRTSSSPPDVPALVEAGAPIGNDICTAITGTDPSGVERFICATVEELPQIVSFILMLRKASDAGAPPPEQCIYIPGSTLCATSAERAEAIVRLVHARQARMLRDAGAEGGAR